MEMIRLGMRLAQIAHRGILGTPHKHISRRLYSNGKTNDADKFKEFKDEDANEILDVHEERLKAAELALRDLQRTELDLPEEPEVRVKQLSLEDLVHFMKNNKAQELTVLKLPPDLKYAEFLLIATGRSRRHIQSLGEAIRKLAKQRLDNISNVPQLEGSDSEWIALDMGNVCIHIMSPTLRGAYDLESLWGVGSKYDIKLHQQDEKILTLLKMHSYSSYGTDKISNSADNVHQTSSSTSQVST